MPRAVLLGSLDEALDLPIEAARRSSSNVLSTHMANIDMALLRRRRC
jgi:hypothetical protein